MLSKGKQFSLAGECICTYTTKLIHFMPNRAE